MVHREAMGGHNCSSTVCGMLHVCGEGVKGTSGTCLELLLTWFPVVPAARMEHGCGAGLAHSSPPLVPGGLRAGGGVGLVVRKRWTSCQETLWEAKSPRVGWMEEVAQGGLCVCPPSAHPASQEQEKHRGCLEDTNILSEGSGRANRGCG